MTVPVSMSVSPVVDIFVLGLMHDILDAQKAIDDAHDEDEREDGRVGSEPIQKSEDLHFGADERLKADKPTEYIWRHSVYILTCPALMCIFLQRNGWLYTKVWLTDSQKQGSLDLGQSTSIVLIVLALSNNYRLVCRNELLLHSERVIPSPHSKKKSEL